MGDKLPDKYRKIDIKYKKERIKFDFGEIKTKDLRVIEIQEAMDSISNLLFYFGNLKSSLEKTCNKIEEDFDFWIKEEMTLRSNGKKSDKALEREAIVNNKEEWHSYKKKIRSILYKKNVISYAVRSLEKRADLLKSIGSLKKMLIERNEDKDFKKH